MTKIYYVFAKDIHIPPSELDEMYWYDIMYILKEHQTHVEEENEQMQTAESDYSEKYGNLTQPQVPKFEMPKMPDIGNLSNFKF